MDGIQVQDLIDMLSRIEDKSARVKLSVTTLVMGDSGPLPHNYVRHADTVKKTAEREYTIFGV